jgi:PLP dependent protein
MANVEQRIAENLAAIRARIAAAAARVGREPDEVQLVAVTKYAPLPYLAALAAAGCHEFGESRPQQLWQRAEELKHLPIRWHMIGHLQRNKAKRTLPLCARIHSADTPQLLETLDQAAAEQQGPTKVLLEVNVSGEAAKHGFAPNEVAAAIAQLPQWPHLEVDGLMCMAALDGGLDEARRDFARLRQLRDELLPAAPPGVRLAELSMGMSGDFEVAIEEGATIVRVGSALFEGLEA